MPNDDPPPETSPKPSLARRVGLACVGLTYLALFLAPGFIRGDWFGAYALGWLAAVGAPTVLAMKGWERLQDARAHRRWTASTRQIEYTEKVEQLGHTQGGLSELRADREGALSESRSHAGSVAAD